MQSKAVLGMGGGGEGTGSLLRGAEGVGQLAPLPACSSSHSHFSLTRGNRRTGRPLESTEAGIKPAKWTGECADQTLHSRHGPAAPV